MKLQINLGGEHYTFKNLKELLAKANEEKSGDRLAKIAAETVQERVAAKYLVADLLLHEIRNEPLIDTEDDEVSRIIENDINEKIYGEIKNWSVSEMREYILRNDVGNSELMRISRGLTYDMMSAVKKLMSNLELVHAANKIEVITTSNISIGHKGTLISRLQPNHPTDNIDGIITSLKEGLSYGIGDAVLGINPVDDSVESVKRVFHATKDF